MSNSRQVVYIDFGETYGESGSSGIERKKLAQIKELGKLGEVRRLTFSPEKKRSFFGNLSRMLPLFPSMFFIKFDEESLKNIDIVYFRKPAYIDRYTIKLLKLIKKLNPKCLILFELPTYPYDKEKRGAVKYPLLLKDRWNRRKLHTYVDRMVVVASLASSVFNVPAISIVNGIDFSQTGLKRTKRTTDGSVHAIFTATFTFWHGLDRVVEGMNLYYSNPNNKRKFILHLVGSTEQVNNLNETIANLEADGTIIAYGEKSFNEAEKIYDDVSIGLDVFGMHRVQPGLVSSSIKSREYGAKGLPIVSESIIDYIPEDYAYYLKVPEDDSPLNIEAVIAFHDSIYSKDAEIVSNEIRSFSKEYCSSEAMMKPVIEFCQTASASSKNLHANAKGM